MPIMRKEASQTSLEKSQSSCEKSSLYSYSRPLLPHSSMACTQTIYDAECHISVIKCQPNL